MGRENIQIPSPPLHRDPTLWEATSWAGPTATTPGWAAPSLDVLIYDLFQRADFPSSLFWLFPRFRPTLLMFSCFVSKKLLFWRKTVYLDDLWWKLVNCTVRGHRLAVFDGQFVTKNAVTSTATNEDPHVMALFVTNAHPTCVSVLRGVLVSKGGPTCQVSHGQTNFVTNFLCRRTVPRGSLTNKLRPHM